MSARPKDQPTARKISTEDIINTFTLYLTTVRDTTEVDNVTNGHNRLLQAHPTSKSSYLSASNPLPPICNARAYFISSWRHFTVALIVNRDPIYVLTFTNVLRDNVASI